VARAHTVVVVGRHVRLVLVEGTVVQVGVHVHHVQQVLTKAVQAKVVVRRALLELIQEAVQRHVVPVQLALTILLFASLLVLLVQQESTVVLVGDTVIPVQPVHIRNHVGLVVIVVLLVVTVKQVLLVHIVAIVRTSKDVLIVLPELTPLSSLVLVPIVLPVDMLVVKVGVVVQFVP
jgi:hypothetical protein